MSRRVVLRKQIKQAWSQSMSLDYEQQLINSERSLQASVWANLKGSLDSKKRRMFIEPCLLLGGKEGDEREMRYPDLVICNTRHVIAIIELKYLPRAIPKWTKDLKTFRWIADKKAKLTVSNSRFRDVASTARQYPLADDVLYVWAGVHAACDINLVDQIDKDLTPCFLALHAETRRSKRIQLR